MNRIQVAAVSYSAGEILPPFVGSMKSASNQYLHIVEVYFFVLWSS